MNAHLYEKGVSGKDAVPVRMRIEWHKSLEGRSGRQGREHMKQICEGIREFYSRVMAGLRSVESMPVQTPPPPVMAEEPIPVVTDGELPQ